MKKFLYFVIVVALCGGGYFYWRHRVAGAKKDAPVVYRTVKVARATITQEVSATGTIQPIQKVDVGTQVTGKILKLYADFNSTVKAGQVVAEVDPATYKASYAAAQAQLSSALANLERTKATLKLSEKELVRQKALLDKDMISASEYDTSVTERDKLAAEVKMNEASIETARANANQAKTNLDYCTIVSPVTGVVISRSVDEGQTVVSNMSVSSLFVIATDLSRVKVEASVPEADVGHLKVGQDVRFTVDAYRESFKGKVTQIRLSASTESNVVTYPVIVEAENPNGKLFPGMTATLSIIISSADNCVSVPTSALRFTPTGEDKKLAGKRIWIAKSQNEIEPVEIKLGVSDGINQQLIGAEDLEGKDVATGIMTANELKGGSQGGTSNPFQMRPPGRR